MLKRAVWALMCWVGWLIVPLAVQAAPIVVDFESLADSSSVTNQFSGLTFSHATALTAGVSLNEIEFPPRSGANVLFDDGGAITINFATAVTSVAGYFTYLNPLQFNAYDAGSNLVASDTSAFSSNLALSGDAGSATNELLGVAFAGGISRIVITGDTAGSSFVLDDLVYERGEIIVDAPEPGTLALVMSSLLLIGTFSHRRSSRGRLEESKRSFTE